MKSKILFFILMPLWGFGQTKIDYQVFFQDNMEAKGLKLKISTSLKKATDSTYFHYSNEVWGETNLLQCVADLSADNAQYRFKIVPDSNRIVVYHPKSKVLSFYYSIKQDYKGDDIAIFNRPRVKDQFFHILGQSLFVVPEVIFEKNNSDPSIIANIEWIGFPEGFVIHNTFGSQQKIQHLKVKLWSEFYHSLFVGGDYRLYSFQYQKKPIYFAIRGNWQTYDDKTLLAKLERTVTTQRAFWNDSSFDYYTVIFTPTVTQMDSTFRGQSTTGSNIKNGFMIQSSNNPFNHWGVVNYIFNHEMMHDWIGGKISMKNEELHYWFSEGFTDYYTYKNRVRSGDISPKDWLQDFNKDVLKAHYENPQRNQPNFTVKDSFWTDRNFEKIPYRRGAIFALWLDLKIMKSSNFSKSLDDLMRDVLNACTTENKKFTDDLFLSLSQKYLQEDIAYFFQKHVISGVDIAFHANDLIEGFSFQKKENILVLSASDEAVKKYLQLKN